MTATDEVLVELVACRVETPGEDRELRPGEGPHEESAENGVFGQVRELAQDEVPMTEICPEAWDRRERKDHRRHENDRSPRPDSCCRHRTMIGSADIRECGEGTRCESGTVPPL